MSTFLPITALLYLILERINTMSLTQAELVVKMDALTAQVVKIKTEVKDAVAALIARLAETGVPVDPVVEDALARLTAAIKTVDDLNPDAPVPAPAPAPV